MEAGNQTTVLDFILLGLTSDPKLQVPLFIFFLLVYIITVVDNIGIVFIYCTDFHLHTPMYFFLSNLSIVDLCYTSTVTPKMLMGFMVNRNVISVSGCAIQLFVVSAFCIAEFVLISVMAFDRYTAICRPLHYTTIMTKRFCIQLAAGPYVTGLMSGVVYTIITFRVSFCGDNKIDHFFCDLLPLFKLSCMDTSLNEMIVYTIVITFGSCNILMLSVSYACIIISILRIRSSTGRRRVFSTCSSHFVCVVLFYGTSMYMYLSPNTRNSDTKDKVMSVFYTIIIAMLNPLIYSLRNQDVKAAFWRILKSKRASHDA